MAFTSAQAAKIRFYLGFPQVGYRELQAGFEGMIIYVGNDVDAEAIVTAILLQLDAITSTITDPTNAQIAGGIIEVDDVKFAARGSTMTSNIAAVGRMLVQQLAACFCVEPARNVFGTSTLPYWGLG